MQSNGEGEREMCDKTPLLQQGRHHGTGQRTGQAAPIPCYKTYNMVLHDLQILPPTHLLPGR